jgi:hypothetical protein
MTRDEFVDMLIAEYEKQQQIKAINAQRTAEETALVQEYKVDECNAKRNALVQKYTAMIKAI